MNTLKTTRAALTAGLLLLTALPLAACGNTSSPGTHPGTPASSVGCAATNPKVEAGTPTIAILGVTGSKLADFQQDIDMVLHTAAAEKARVIVNGVSDGTDTPTLLSNVVLAAEGNNTLERTRNLTCMTESVNKSIAALKEGETPKQPNAFDAISVLAGNLDNNPSNEPVDVILLTPLSAKTGDANTGIVDLSDPATLNNPVGTINTLAKNGLIPTCKNYRFYGVSPDTGLSAVDAAKLRDFWQLYATKCGGQIVAWTDHLATFPIANAITPTDETQISVQQTPETITATLASDVLFGPDSALLQPTAAPALNDLLGLATHNNGKIRITGYVNPVETGSASGLELSEERAAAVASWLIAHGIPASRITTLGKGATDAVYPDPQSDAQSAANRRVVAAITTHE